MSVTISSVMSSPSPSPQSTKGSHKRAASEAQRAGKSLVDEVILPLIQKVRAFSYVKPACAWSEHDQQTTKDDMDAREIESLSMISRGFEELRDVNPELAYNIILDILSGINEYVSVCSASARY